MSEVYGRYPRNGRTAREMAAKVGISVRTAQRWTSQPRDEYLAAVAQRREKIRALRAKGLSMRAIAAEVGCGVGVGTVHRALSAD
ncbi:hypothetical protein JMX53_03225 [Cutibacterium avidum]|uniref:hypothetical protein n=1 Tax=Cutibacterium avidum TaxID=33010 RepID=UPI00192AF4AD|nr:hypothetical protein [Cutibacterium avidum]QQY15588.1 hypothetical protein JMX53_03225 [Cutibacterium avidum]